MVTHFSSKHAKLKRSSCFICKFSLGPFLTTPFSSLGSNLLTLNTCPNWKMINALTLIMCCWWCRNSNVSRVSGVPLLCMENTSTIYAKDEMLYILLFVVNPQRHWSNDSGAPLCYRLGKSESTVKYQVLKEYKRASPRQRIVGCR